jgi:hypothetical protein
MKIARREASRFESGEGHQTASHLEYQSDPQRTDTRKPVVDTLYTIFPNPDDLLSLEAEELGGVLLEIAPGVMQNGMFNIGALLAPVFPVVGAGYPVGLQSSVRITVAEALSWLISQGLLILDPDQPSNWYRPTRRAKTLKTRADVAAFRKGRMLPVELLPPILIAKTWPLFLRGDHDVAVFQAFKEVEVSVRKAANAKGAGYPDDLVGVTLMRRAFHPESGPLTDGSRVTAEREAEMALFAGSIGHAKNPPGHRDVDVTPLEAARLIIFAAYLLNIVDQR